MAYRFDRDASQYLGADVAEAVTQPLALFAKARSSHTADSQGVLFYGDKDVAANRYLFQLQAAANTPVRYILQNLAGVTTALVHTPGFTTNQWTKLVARSLEATDHKFWQDGKTPQTSSTSNTPSNTDRVEVGRQGGSSASSYLEGDVAYIAIAEALTDTQAEQLCAGRHPRNVFGTDELVNLWTFQTEGDLEDEISGLTLTAVNSPTFQSNPVELWTGNNTSLSTSSEATIEGTGFNDVKSTGKVELADSATYASATKVEQTTSEWSDDLCKFTPNLGTLEAGTLYVYVTNSAGNRSDPLEVTVTEGGALVPTISSTPSSVKDKTVQVVTGINFGTYGPNSKVELSDDSTYGDGTLVEQPIIEDQHQTREAEAVPYWSSTSITFRYRLGSLNAGTLYLFITNNNEQTSEAEEITVADWSFEDTPSSQVSSASNGEVIEDLDIDVDGSDGISITHDNVTVRNCRIRFTQGLEGPTDAANGIEAVSADNLTIQDCEIILSDPSTGQNPLDTRSLCMRIFGCTTVRIERVKVTDGASGVYAENTSDIRIKQYEAHRMRGPFPRGQGVQFNNCSGSPVIEDFYILNPNNNSYPEDNINNFSTDGVTIRRGIIDGCNAPTGTAIMFEQESANSLVEDVQIYRHANGGPSAYIGHDITLRRVDVKHWTTGDLGRGAPSSGGLCYVAHPDSTGLVAEDCRYYDLGGALLVWDASSFDSREMTEEDWEEVEPITLQFPWSIEEAISGQIDPPMLGTIPTLFNHSVSTPSGTASRLLLLGVG